MPALRIPSIPIVDLSDFKSKDTDREPTTQQKDAAESLVRACRDQGFVGISGHGFSQKTLEGLFNASRKLFDMPVQDKMKAPHPIDSYVPHRGYTGVGGEKCVTKEEAIEHSKDEDSWTTKASVKDFKESFEVGSEHNKVHYNIWYPEALLPGFQKTTLSAYWELHSICLQILEAFMLGLALTEPEKDGIRALHTGLNDQLRLLHYPSLPVAAASDAANGWMQAHTDWSTFTILFQDSCGGLEFGDRAADGGFVPATPREGIVYLNVGDMLTRMSNGAYNIQTKHSLSKAMLTYGVDYLPSALHRVVMPDARVKDEDGDLVTPQRYSIPFFFMPDEDKKVFTPESVIAAHGRRAYEPITMLEYVELRSKWLYKKE